MIFFSLFCALLIDHFRPTRAGEFFSGSIRMIAGCVRKWCDTGLVHHARMGWIMVVVIFTLPVLVVYWICLAIHPFFGLLWNIMILYLCMGFRHYYHYFTSIQMALLSGENLRARNMLAEWCHDGMENVGDAEITSLTIEKALITVLKDVFGVIFWFALPFGPAGAVFYRVAVGLRKCWSDQNGDRNNFSRFSGRMSCWVNWIPVRLMAVSFAAVGNFEGAVYGWRNESSRWKSGNAGILLASAGGAMGIRLGVTGKHGEQGTDQDTGSGSFATDEPVLPHWPQPTIRFLQSTLGLIWRTLLLWLVLLFLFTMTFYLA